MPSSHQTPWWPPKWHNGLGDSKKPGSSRDQEQYNKRCFHYSNHSGNLEEFRNSASGTEGRGQRSSFCQMVFLRPLFALHTACALVSAYVLLPQHMPTGCALWHPSLSSTGPFHSLYGFFVSPFFTVGLLLKILWPRKRLHSLASNPVNSVSTLLLVYIRLLIATLLN